MRFVFNLVGLEEVTEDGWAKYEKLTLIADLDLLFSLCQRFSH